MREGRRMNFAWRDASRVDAKERRRMLANVDSLW
jgi:hypothetical protein